MTASSILVPARREKAQEDTPQKKKKPTSSIHVLPVTLKGDEPDRDKLQLFGFDLPKRTIETKETRVKTHNQ